MACSSCGAKDHRATDTHLRDDGVRIENHKPQNPLGLLYISSTLFFNFIVLPPKT